MSDQRMAGKVSLVTGAGSRGEGIGNGRASALLLARHGAKVALVDLHAQHAEETAKLIAGEGGESLVIAADVSRASDCRQAVKACVDKWGRLDVLVNNVGIDGPAGNSVDVDLDAWDRAMAVNVKAPVMMAKYAVPEMLEHGGGAIVNIASFAGLVGGHPAIFYPTSKGAVVNMTRAMAAQHGQSGIRVNCVAPGAVYTPMVSAAGMAPEAREARKNRSLLKTEGTGWDVGYAVLFLASDEARWITGVILPVDAGASAGLPLLSSAPAGTMQR